MSKTYSKPTLSGIRGIALRLNIPTREIQARLIRLKNIKFGIRQRIRKHKTPEARAAALEYFKAYNAKRAEKIKNLSKEEKQLRVKKVQAWRKRNRKEYLEYQNTYQEENREIIRYRCKRYRQENPEMVRLFAATRRARKRSTSENPQAVKQFYIDAKKGNHTCHWCKTIIPKGLIEVDHIIPLSKGGRHAPDNLCYACQSCNRHKKDRMPEEFKKILACGFNVKVIEKPQRLDESSGVGLLNPNIQS
jgi:5-methylcytosine-specific restriction endonuclease McrA